MRTESDLSAQEEIAACEFCGAVALHVLARGLHHPRVLSHGPVDIHTCGDCGSMVTWPVPSADALARLYASFDEGIDPTLRRLRQDAPPSAWYAHAARRAARAADVTRDSTFSWMDIGAGAGEIGEELNRNFPAASGISVDWHSRPSGLTNDSRHAWVACDLNASGFADAIGARADIVISLSVWEHVRHPAQFIRNVSALVNPGGTLYLVCPDYGSLAARTMGRHWPYWIPGEHLHVPTQCGAQRCLQRNVTDRTCANAVYVHSVRVPYPFAYVIAFFGLPALGRTLRGLPTVPLPVGALEAGFTGRAQT